MRVRIRRVTGAPVQLWIIQDTSAIADHYDGPNPVTFGRRTIDLPPASWLAATWHEAIRYATAGTPPRPLHHVYPEYCGWIPFQPSGLSLPTVKIREGANHA